MTQALDQRIADELRFFDSEEQRQAFLAAKVPPYTQATTWQYSDEVHACAVVAFDGRTEIVYCATGFGPAFPWTWQVAGGGDGDMGMDSDWYAYLYEAFVQSGMWPAGPPEGFVCTGPGDREA